MALVQNFFTVKFENDVVVPEVGQGCWSVGVDFQNPGSSDSIEKKFLGGFVVEVIVQFDSEVS